MAIFGNLGRKISDAGQTVAQQTKDMAETTKLNGQISALEKKLNELFLTFGRTCYEQQKDDASSENREALDEIGGIYDQIQSLNERIKQIKGFEKCPRCGADVPNDALFCSNCGLKIERAQSVQRRQMFCLNCGAKLADGARFCVVCGTPVGNVPEKTGGDREETRQEPEDLTDGSEIS